MTKLHILLLSLFSISCGSVYSWGFIHLGPGFCRSGVILKAASKPKLVMSTVDDILHLEEELKEAMLDSDASKLDSLLDNDLIFTNHVGMTMGKQDDLNAHKDGVVDIQALELSDMQVKLAPSGTAIVTVAAHIVGSFAGDPFEDTLRFTRVWQPSEGGKWKLVAAHSSLVVKT